MKGFSYQISAPTIIFFNRKTTVCRGSFISVPTIIIFSLTGKPPSIEVPLGPYPMPVHIVYGNNNHRTKVVLQAYAFTKYLGNARLQFDQNGELVKWSGNPILLDQSIDEDESTRKEIAHWKTKVDVLAEVSIVKLLQKYSEIIHGRASPGEYRS